MNEIKNMEWNVAVLYIDWRADRHSECHSIEFERPTADNPSPQYPVEKGGILSKARLPMSDTWGQLFATIVVKSFDDESLTVEYGQTTYTVHAGKPSVELGKGGMNYTYFCLSLGVK